MIILYLLDFVVFFPLFLQNPTKRFGRTGPVVQDIYFILFIFYFNVTTGLFFITLNSKCVSQEKSPALHILVFKVL